MLCVRWGDTPTSPTRATAARSVLNTHNKVYVYYDDTASSNKKQIDIAKKHRELYNKTIRQAFYCAKEMCKMWTVDVTIWIDYNR